MIESSTDREPWRTFESSLAIQFVSDTDWHCAPDAAQFDKQAVLTAIAARQSAAQALARLKSALFHFVRDATALPQHAHLHPVNYHCEKELRSVARSILIAPGPCSDHRDGILPLLTWLDDFGPELELFLEGFLQIRERRSGEVEFLLERFRARRRLDTCEVKSRGEELCALFDDAVGKVTKASEQVRAGPPPSSRSPWSAS
jgi:hypothetical protein